MLGLSTRVSFMCGSFLAIAAAVIQPDDPPPTIRIDLIL
jgi:hypothetical protein